MVKRFFDLGLAIVLLASIFPFILLIAIIIKLTSKGEIIHWSNRIGFLNKTFLMPKFRTMKVNTPSLATHLMDNPNCYLTSFGTFLRKTSLDELPQLWNILIGEMSFVGPRPALYNQYDLIELRTAKGLQTLVPGLTGWAQINGRDSISILEKVKFDEEYLKRKSLLFDLKILLLTFAKVISREDVQH